MTIHHKCGDKSTQFNVLDITKHTSTTMPHEDIPMRQSETRYSKLVKHSNKCLKMTQYGGMGNPAQGNTVIQHQITIHLALPHLSYVVFERWKAERTGAAPCQPKP